MYGTGIRPRMGIQRYIGTYVWEHVLYGNRSVREPGLCARSGNVSLWDVSVDRSPIYVDAIRVERDLQNQNMVSKRTGTRGFAVHRRPQLLLLYGPPKLFNEKNWVLRSCGRTHLRLGSLPLPRAHWSHANNEES